MFISIISFYEFYFEEFLNPKIEHYGRRPLLKNIDLPFITTLDAIKNEFANANPFNHNALIIV